MCLFLWRTGRKEAILLVNEWTWRIEDMSKHRVEIRRYWMVPAVTIAVGLALTAVVFLGRGRTVPAGTLAGKVIDENKSVVRNAQVYVYSPSDANRVEVRTDWLGNFRLEGVPRDREFGVMVSWIRKASSPAPRSMRISSRG